MKTCSHLDISGNRVLTISLNRPQVKNALNDQTLRELERAFRSVSPNQTRAVILAGRGGTFCAGADIEWMRRAGRLKGARAREDASLLVKACRAVNECSVPVIARVEGAVYGGGLGLLAAADVAVASEDARLCFSECRLGIAPAAISTVVLSKISAHARRYYLTAEVFGAAEARRIGLVHEVVTASGLDSKIQDIVRNILKNGPRAVSAAKTLLRNLQGKGFDESARIALAALLRLRSSPEGQEGLSAFLEKRPPAWAAELETPA